MQRFATPIVLRPGEAVPAKLDEIARRHGMEVVGLVPEGYL